MRLLLICLLYSCTNFAQQWEDLSPFPGPGRDDAVGFSIGEYVYVTTGNPGIFSESNRTYRSKNDVTFWEEVSPFPGTPRQYAAGFSLNGKGYVVGGISENGQALNDCWSYHPVYDLWEQLVDFPGIAHWGASATSNSNAGFLAGGTNGTAVLNHVWMYNPETDSWSILPPLPGTGSREGVLVALSNRLIYTGGFRITPLECLTDTYLFDFSTASWSSGSPLPGNHVAYLTGTVFDHQALLAGGWSCDGSFTAAAWLTDGLNWHALPDLPFSGIRGMSACTTNGQAYFFSGLLDNGQRSTQVSRFGDVMQLDDCMIYPNPSSGVMTFSAPIESHLRILTTSGKLVLETDFKESTISLDAPLSEGLYLAEFLLNGQRKTAKIVITSQ